MNRKSIWTAVMLISITAVFSCKSPTYFETNQSAMQLYFNGKYAQALIELEKNDYLKQPFNQTLYNLEKGKILFNAGDYLHSYAYLAAADDSIENWKDFRHRSINGQTVIINDHRYMKDGSAVPKDGEMSQGFSQMRGSYSRFSYMSFTSKRKSKYHCEDYERPFINYYNALNTYFIPSNAEIVEAKRLNEQSENLDLKKFPEAGIPYSTNPFGPILSACIYEEQGRLNDAFISNEQALNAFQDQYCQSHYGVEIPWQLKYDLINQAAILHFTDKLENYMRLFQIKPDSSYRNEHYAIIFIDNGKCPHKTETKKNQSTPAGYRSDIAHYPYYETWETPAEIKTVQCSRQTSIPYRICNLQYVFSTVLNERIRKEMSEIPISGTTTTTNGQTKTVNSTHFDTRNWQTLPAEVYYTRVQLHPGKNQIILTYTKEGKTVELSKEVESNQYTRFVYFQIP